MKLQEIERLRAVAVLITVFSHLHRIPKHPYFGSGIGGVYLFFVISGFVISTSFLKILPAFDPKSSFYDRLLSSKQTLKIFFIKRFYRIMPLAIAWCLIPLFVTLLSKTPEALFMPLLKEVLAILTFQYNYAMIYGNWRFLTHYWSLSVEEQFYMIFPFLMVAFVSLQRRFLVVLGGIALIVRAGNEHRE